MKKTLVLASCLLFSALASAQTIDAKQTMKEMRHVFIQAVEAESLTEMKTALAEFDTLVDRSKQAPYPEEKKALFIEGLDKVSAAVDKVQQLADAGNFEQARAMLQEVDSLRKEYHDKRNTSIWQRLFG